MYALSPLNELSRVHRRPAKWRELEGAGWIFMAVRERWDADARQRLTDAVELNAVHPDAAAICDTDWWVRFLDAYLTTPDVSRALKAAGLAP